MRQSIEFYAEWAAGVLPSRPIEETTKALADSLQTRQGVGEALAGLLACYSRAGIDPTDLVEAAIRGAAHNAACETARKREEQSKSEQQSKLGQSATSEQIEPHEQHRETRSQLTEPSTPPIHQSITQPTPQPKAMAADESAAALARSKRKISG